MGTTPASDAGLAKLSIAILVPVLDRPHRIEPILDSVTSSTSAEHRLLFIASPDDTAEMAELESLGADFHVAPAWRRAQGQYAKKINLGYRITDEEWVFLGADDLEFTSGWDEAALKVGSHTHAGVVGTNDDAHPLVKKGSHATHPLVRRTYISEEAGGPFDGTGEIYCELYDHQWVDNEFIDTARRRGRFAFARNSVVRHLHPHWGTAPMDATYEAGHAGGERDRLLYIQRLNELRRVQRQRRAVR